MNNNDKKSKLVIKKVDAKTIKEGNETMNKIENLNTDSSNPKNYEIFKLSK